MNMDITEQAFIIVAELVETIQSNDDVDFSDKKLIAVLEKAKTWLHANDVVFHDETLVKDDEDDSEDSEEEGWDDEFDHIDGYSSKFIIMNSSPDIEWTASDFD